MVRTKSRVRKLLRRFPMVFASGETASWLFRAPKAKTKGGKLSSLKTFFGFNGCGNTPSQRQTATSLGNHGEPFWRAVGFVDLSFDASRKTLRVATGVLVATVIAFSLRAFVGCSAVRAYRGVAP